MTLTLNPDWGAGAGILLLALRQTLYLEDDWSHTIRAATDCYALLLEVG